MKQYKASVIIPCYNGEAFLRESIESVLNQSCDNVQLILVNDGSTDNSYNIMAEYAGCADIVNQENAGVCSARNAGLKRAKGETIAFLDADDYWHKDFLSLMIEALEKNKADIVYCGWQNIGLPGKSGEPYVPLDYGTGKNRLMYLLRDPGWPVHAVVLKSDKILNKQFFNLKWNSGEDFAFWLELVFSLKLTRVARVLAFYRHHEMGQATKRRDENAIMHWQVQKEFIKTYPEIVNKLSKNELKKITHGRLMKKGFICYWDGDIKCAKNIFLNVLKTGYGSFNDWKYMLPAVLPLKIYEMMVRIFRKI